MKNVLEDTSAEHTASEPCRGGVWGEPACPGDKDAGLGCGEAFPGWQGHGQVLGRLGEGFARLAPGRVGNVPQGAEQALGPDADSSILLRFLALLSRFPRGNCISSRRCSKPPPSPRRVWLCQPCEPPPPLVGSSPKRAITYLRKEGT